MDKCIGCPITYTYTFEEVRELLGDLFTVLEIKKDHIFAYKIDEYRNHQYVKEDCWKNVDENTFRQLEKELGWHTLVAATCNK